MFIAALTGGIGAGKSTIANLLADRGATIIDVDAIGRSVLEPGAGAYTDVVAEFGAAILDARGSIDRSSLARLVFGDADQLRRLTAISHPAINAELVRRLDVLPRDSIALLDMAILAEGELGRPDPEHTYQFVIAVEAPVALRIRRAVERGMPEDEVRRRIDAQATDSERASLADVVVVNDGALADLTATIGALWLRLVAARDERHRVAAQ